jgi:hypothetical protein
MTLGTMNDSLDKEAILATSRVDDTVLWILGRRRCKNRTAVQRGDWTGASACRGLRIALA